jgi:hypothetical protein
MKMPKTAAVACALGVLVIGIILIGLQDRIRERWYLYRFRHGDPEAQREAVKELGKIGSETSFMALQEYGVRYVPQLILRWGLPDLDVSGGSKGIRLYPENEYSIVGEAAAAVREIEERIGLAARQATGMRYLEDPASDSRFRLWLAQLLILSLTPTEKLPPELQPHGGDEQIRSLAPGTKEYEHFHAHKPRAIAVCAEALLSADAYERGGAVFALALCAEESDEAVQALRGVTADPDPYVGKAAAEVLAQLGK